MQLGITLKTIRKQQGLSQKEVCRGICAQSMLSAIENNQYTPNAELLIQLCKRLSISLSVFSLADNFDISSNDQFNHTVDELCNHHEYVKLKSFLLSQSTLNHIETSEQTQAYYYYLGVSQFHTDRDLNDAHNNLRMSVNIAEEKKSLSTLTRLGLISLAVITCRYRQLAMTTKLINQAMQNIDTAHYEPNLNIIFYLAAFIAYESTEDTLALSRAQNAIDYISKHDSHYMLANCYHLVAQIAKQQNDVDRALEASQRQKFLQDLFHEHVDNQF